MRRGEDLKIMMPKLPIQFPHWALHCSTNPCRGGLLDLKKDSFFVTWLNTVTLHTSSIGTCYDLPDQEYPRMTCVPRIDLRKLDY